MSEVKLINAGDKFTHATVGSLHEFEGKQFVKDTTGATSCEKEHSAEENHREHRKLYE